jgi:hypothetical protein
LIIPTWDGAEKPVSTLLRSGATFQAGTSGDPGGQKLDAAATRSRAETVMCRLLAVPNQNGCPAGNDGDSTTYRIFHTSIVLSALRCLLSYVVFPIVTPLVGAATRIGPAFGLPVAVLALVFDVIGLRRFWLSNHRWKWPMTALYAGVMGLVLALLVGDVLSLF